MGQYGKSNLFIAFQPAMMDKTTFVKQMFLSIWPGLVLQESGTIWIIFHQNFDLTQPPPLA